MAVRLKTDENLPDSAAMLLRAAGHHVATVIEEKLGGASDPQVAEDCRSEARAFVTLDRGLGNIRAYPPKHYHGIVVLRPRDQSVDGILSLVQTFVSLLETNSLAGTLWIISARHGSDWRCQLVALSMFGERPVTVVVIAPGVSPGSFRAWKQIAGGAIQ